MGTPHRAAHSRDRPAVEGTGVCEQLGCLLMNIVCCRRTLRNPALSSMQGVPSGLVPQFGFRPGILLRTGKTDRTEIDMKLGVLLVEAKLMETDCQAVSTRMIARYRDLEEVFDLAELTMSGDVIPNYQLIRASSPPMRRADRSAFFATRGDRT
jgi:hypothetical protein